MSQIFTLFATINYFNNDKSIEIQVFNKIKKAKGGSLFFVNSFSAITNAKSVNKALERLVNPCELHQVAMGIYVRPVKDKTIGIVLPC